MYLWSAGPGTGRWRARAVASGRRTRGTWSGTGRPRSTTPTSPARWRAGGRARQPLRQVKVTVRSAARTGPATVPSSTPVPLGTSTASTAKGRTPGRPAATSGRTRSAALGRRGPVAPMPVSPSTTRSGRSPTSTGGAPGQGPPGPGTGGSGSGRTPAARASSQAMAWGRSVARATRTTQPRRARSAPARSVSAPLWPPPTRSSTRDPVTWLPGRPGLVRRSSLRASRATAWAAARRYRSVAAVRGASTALTAAAG